MEGPSAVIITLILLLAGTGLTLQIWRLNYMQSEVDEINSEIERLKGLMNEHDGYDSKGDGMSLEAFVDVEFPQQPPRDTQLRFEFADLARELGESQEEGLEPWIDVEAGKLRVRRDATDKRKRRNKEKRLNAYCMHFILDQERVEQSEYQCDKDVLEKTEPSVPLLCSVREVPFWKNTLDHKMSTGRLHSAHSKLEISRNGTYLIYAQITLYDKLYGPFYQILRQTSGSSEPEILSSCAALESFGSNVHNMTGMDVFNQCHTDRAVRLREGDSVYLLNKRATSIVRGEPHLTFWGLLWLAD